VGKLQFCHRKVVENKEKLLICKERKQPKQLTVNEAQAMKRTSERLFKRKRA
jgi:hypothetical protein